MGVKTLINKWSRLFEWEVIFILREIIFYKIAVISSYDWYYTLDSFRSILFNLLQIH